MMRYSLALSAVLLAFACSNKQDDRSLTEVVAELNRKCPKMVDSETRIDSITCVENQSLSYWFTLPNVKSPNADTVAFKRALWPGLLANIRVDQEMAKLRDAGIQIRYIYRSAQRAPLGTLVFSPQDYR